MLHVDELNETLTDRQIDTRQTKSCLVASHEGKAGYTK